MPVHQIANVDFIKQVNCATVYRLIDQQGPISRVRIAEISQLAPASITKITRQLLENGLIREVALQASTGGRRAVSLTTVQEKFQLISAKVARGYMQLDLYNLSGDIIACHKVSLPSVEQHEVVCDLLDAIDNFAKKHHDSFHRLIGIAVTLPGLIDPNSGTVIYNPRYNFHQLPLARILEERFHCRAFIGNDIRALALAEYWHGASQDCLDSILISVHQGIGAGIIVNGKVFLGQKSNVGEIGHIQVDPLGKRCHCGNFGCLETLVSNDAIVSKVRELVSHRPNSALKNDEITIEQICEAALEGDELSCSVLENVGEQLGRVIAILVNLINPQKILLTGEIVAASRILLPAITRCVERQSLADFHKNLPIECATFQNQPTIGGFALIKRALLEERLLQDLMRHY